ncbi:helix-turn-helix domain-containing protein [Yinghuangia seranimata]|uniref:helix-turn-helix domain-containing protein n=1 Tax=Yinghuangia seranimata TaxID=408067 RepID=UPI00248B473C|nr:helix-turn-helix domain-containing protein [Yinghuangia seranimata]MDI2132348.1 helix-turn-helix domain-containing protein [Yinghuangia seranimata]
MSTAVATVRDGAVALILAGQIGAAERVAAVLGAKLPDPARVFLVDTRPEARGDVLAHPLIAGDPSLWAGRCPNRRHTVVIAPPSGPLFSADDAHPKWRVTASVSVPLRDIASAYRHALADMLTPPRAAGRDSVPRGLESGLASVAGDVGRRWAAAFLRPLHEHEPARAQDPARDDLVATARTWLLSARDAPRRLFLHRSTVAARIRLIGALLGVDLATVGARAKLALALGIDTGRRAESVSVAGGAERFADVLAQPAATAWALGLLGDVLHAHGSVDAVTLSVWLQCDCEMQAVAHILCITVPGLRKRLIRLGERLSMDLLTPPAQHDLWLAMRALDC